MSVMRIACAKCGKTMWVAVTDSAAYVGDVFCDTCSEPRHPIREFRERPRLLRVFGTGRVYGLYRSWGNDIWGALVLTWRAVVWR